MTAPSPPSPSPSVADDVAGSRLHRWLVRAVVVLGTLVVVLVLIGLGAEDEHNARRGDDRCARDPDVLLVAQSVPSAQTIPCFVTFVDGWTVTNDEVASGGTHLELTTNQIDGATWTVQFDETCTPDASAQEVPSDESGGPAGVSVRERAEETDASYRVIDWYVFAGGCVVSDVYVPFRMDHAVILDDVDQMLRLVPRQKLNDAVLDETDGELPLDPPAGSPG